MVSNIERREAKSKGQQQQRWHYLKTKKLSTLLRGITTNNQGDFYCRNCFHSLRKKRNFNHIKEYAKIKTFVTL